ncbi:kinase-like protein [Rhizoclosmatium globosum]|uniref:Kinase-like protein n=1 Tax=Rhizoclosmatium globosum TaxID=329046 RepID=A0A1Y2C7Y2_9FUNG|nr:kinase-like protein [Rhizoclosmatium globosum]|eukprot:ORY43143.1 kinase-like protein [Rhizoclosmatium globosum]
MSSSEMDVDANLTAPQTNNWDLLPSKGRLYIKIVESRNLFAPSATRPWKPYCVVDFEKNEFITREALQTTVLGPEEAAKAADEALLSYGLEYIQAGGSDESGCWLCPVWKHEASFDVARSDSEVTISVWDRNDGPGGEVFLGMLKIVTPNIHGKVYDHWFRLMPRQWSEKIRGDIRIQLMYKLVEKKSLVADDFAVLTLVGRGTFGKVMLVRKKDTGRVYAMKVLPKKDIVRRQEIVHTMAERSVLIAAIKSPFLVSLKFSFQTPEKLYLVLDYLNGGELFYHLQKEGTFSEELSKFYTAEIACGIEFLHRHGVIYRDLKPENVLLDCNGHVVLADFGLSKLNMGYGQVTNTFCGTPAYLAPEIIIGEGYTNAIDWWALGVLFYEMITGLPPFFSDENVNLMYRKILHNQLLFPIGFSREAEGLVRGLVERDPKLRLGAGPTDALEIKQHPYFSNIDWPRLEKKQIMPPFKPVVESETDTTNFDPVFTIEMPADSLPNNSQPLSTFTQDYFQGFTFNHESAFTNSSMRSIRLEE